MPPRPLRLAARLLLAVGVLGCGAVLGLSAAVLSSWTLGWLLGVGAGLAATWAVPRGAATRLALTTGWAVVVLRLALRRPEGDYVVAADVGGYVLLATSLVLVLVAIATLPGPRRGDGDGTDPADPRPDVASAPREPT